jgi:hypothetical protein
VSTVIIEVCMKRQGTNTHAQSIKRTLILNHVVVAAAVVAAAAAAAWPLAAGG